MPQPVDNPQDFQVRTVAWLRLCFGAAVATDVVERCHRLLEETLAAVQAGGCTRAEALSLVCYVYDRPVGVVSQEVGGVMLTLAAFCHAFQLDMALCGETELMRVWRLVDAIRLKQASERSSKPPPPKTAVEP